MAENGEVPPGNAKGNTTWAIRRAMAKPEIKLTPGKGVQDLTCSIEDLLDQVVKSNKVRSQLSCEATVFELLRRGVQCLHLSLFCVPETNPS